MKHRLNRWVRRGGFTLAEMLVVVAIIALLASLILAAIGKARNAGYRAACSANLHQMHGIGAAWLSKHNFELPNLYWSERALEDYTSATNDYHLQFKGNNYFNSNTWWFALVRDRMDEDTVRCPFDRRDRSGDAWISYVDGDDGSASNKWRRVQSGQVTQTIHLYEDPAGTSNYEHKDGSRNIVYLDGHVETVKP